MCIRDRRVATCLVEADVVCIEVTAVLRGEEISTGHGIACSIVEGVGGSVPSVAEAVEHVEADVCSEAAGTVIHRSEWVVVHSVSVGTTETAEVTEGVVSKVNRSVVVAGRAISTTHGRSRSTGDGQADEVTRRAGLAAHGGVRGEAHRHGVSTNHDAVICVHVAVVQVGTRGSVVDDKLVLREIYDLNLGKIADDVEEVTD